MLVMMSRGLYTTVEHTSDWWWASAERFTEQSLSATYEMH